MKFKASAIIEEVQYVQLKNPYEFNRKWLTVNSVSDYVALDSRLVEYEKFEKDNPPIVWIGSALEEGAELDESEIRIVTEIRHTTGWSTLRDDEVELYTKSNAITRQAATLKAKAEEGEPGREESPICPYCHKSEPCEGVYPEGCFFPKENKLKDQADQVYTIWKSMADCPLKTHLTKWFGFDSKEWDQLAEASTPKEQPGEQEIDILHLHEEWRKTSDLNFFEWFKQQGYSITKQ